MTRIAVAALFAVGVALLALAAAPSLWAPREPYAMTRAPASPEAFRTVSPYGASGADVETLEFVARGVDAPLANAVVATGSDGRPAPLAWRNRVTEPVFFPDLDPADEAQILAAIKAHAPGDAVILAWWDFSRRIRAFAERRAPLDDAEASGLLIPTAWDADSTRIAATQRQFWGADVPEREGRTFQKFIDALLLDEAGGARLLSELAQGRDAFVALRLSDIWRASAARPGALSLGYKDFPAAGDPHGAMKAVREWMAREGVEGGYAVELRGATARVHYLSRGRDAQTLLARLLPFSSSNPLALERLRLVHQFKDYWIYELK